MVRWVALTGARYVRLLDWQVDPYRMGPAAVSGTVRETFRDGACDPLPARLPRPRTHQARTTPAAAKKAAGLSRNMPLLAPAGDVAHMPIRAKFGRARPTLE
jgi:hypothetical protein